MQDGTNMSLGILGRVHEVVHTRKVAHPRAVYTRDHAFPWGQLAGPSGGGTGAHFPSYSDTAEVSGSHLHLAGSGRICSYTDLVL